MVGIVTGRGMWRFQPLDVMSVPQLEQIERDATDPRSAEAGRLMDKHRARYRDYFSPMADPPPRSNYEHATYGDG